MNEEKKSLCESYNIGIKILGLSPKSKNNMLKGNNHKDSGMFELIT